MISGMYRNLPDQEHVCDAAMSPHGSAPRFGWTTLLGSCVVHVSWYEVFDDALSSRPVIAVARAAEAHIGRPPTRSELNAARRAANSYARGSNAQTLLLWSRRDDGRKVQVLLLARVDADLDDTDQLHAVAAGQAAVPRGPGRTHGWRSVESLMSSIVKDAHSSRRVDIDHVDPAHAAQLADDMADALNDFRRLRDRLHYQARHAVAERPTATPPAAPNLTSGPA